MHYFISTDFSITLFGFLSSLAFNNRIENLTLITKLPLFSGGPEAVPLLPAGRAGPADGSAESQLVTRLPSSLALLVPLYKGHTLRHVACMHVALSRLSLLLPFSRTLPRALLVRPVSSLVQSSRPFSPHARPFLWCQRQSRCGAVLCGRGFGLVLR